LKATLRVCIDEGGLVMCHVTGEATVGWENLFWDRRSFMLLLEDDGTFRGGLL